MYVYVWEYRVKPELVTEFKQAYGGSGEWVQLFRNAPAYVRTELLQDRGDPARFLSIDYWTSKEAHKSFVLEHRQEFDSIDKRCEEFTLSESRLGEFDLGRI